MLTIRREQMEALAEPQRRRFFDDLSAAVRDAHPDATRRMSHDALDALVRDGRRRAIGYGLVTRDDTVRFVGVQLALGRDFDRVGAHPWASEFLRSGDGSASERLQTLWENVALQPLASVGNWQ